MLGLDRRLHSPKLYSRSALPLALALLSGCAAIPDVGPHPQPIAPVAIAADRSLSASAAQWPEDGWWRTHGDAQLAALVDEGLARAPDLAAAMARYRTAAAVAQQAVGGTLPSLDVEGGVTVDKQSYNNGFPKAFVPQGWNDSGQLAVGLGFDLDIWGRNRAALSAARAEARAADIDAQQARLLIASGITAAYIDLSRLMEERGIRQTMRDARLATQDLVGKRVGQGLDARASLRQAEAASATARAELAAANEAVMLRRHQIAALLGAGPDRGLDIARPQLPVLAAQGLPEGVTTALIGRRPDIAASRERVEAAAARIKVARADFYPSIRLSAMVGLQSLGLGNLLEGDSTFGSVGPAFSLPVFHGGAVQGRYRGARAAYDGAVADYDRTVLAAYQQVADAVTTRAALATRLAEVRRALAATQDAHALARLRYHSGLSTYLDVLSVEDRLLQARLAASATEAALRTADITLMRSLGGGFAATASPVSAKDTPHD